MNHRFAIAVLGLLSVAAATAACADSAPVIVVPGKSGVPVVINNYDARWAVVEGDWGLSRPGHVTPTVIGGRFVGPIRGEIRRGGYYPTTGTKPAQGRLESETPADQPPQPAENYSRSWSTTSSEPVPPADLPNPNSGMMGEGNPLVPPVIVVPQIGPRRSH